MPFANIFPFLCSIFSIIAGLISLGCCLLIMVLGDYEHDSYAKQFSFGLWIGCSSVLIILCAIVSYCLWKDRDQYVIIDEYGYGRR